MKLFATCTKDDVTLNNLLTRSKTLVQQHICLSNEEVPTHSLVPFEVSCLWPRPPRNIKPMPKNAGKADRAKHHKSEKGSRKKTADVSKSKPDKKADSKTRKKAKSAENES